MQPKEFPHTSGIYLIHNKANNLNYVGQSDNLFRRVKAHECALRNNNHHNVHLQRSWNKYGAENFEFELVEECPIDILDEREVYYISLYNAFTCGYNSTAGGGGMRGFSPTEESRRKMSLSHNDVRGENNPMYGHSVYEYMTDEAIERWKKNISAANTGERNGFYGRKHTDETKQKISEANKGRNLGVHRAPMSENTKRKISEAHNKWLGLNGHPGRIKVVCLNTGVVFDSMSDAGLYSGATHKGIVECCSYKNKSSGSINGERLVWRKYQDYLLMTQDDIVLSIVGAQAPTSGKNSKVAQPVICVNTGEVFVTVTDAAQHYNLDKSSIVKVCRHKNKYCGKDPITNEPLKWEYYESNNYDEANHEYRAS